MNTPLHNVNLTADDITATMLAGAEELEGEEGHVHIHMPNGSLWPLILALSVIVTLGGLLIVNIFPWLSIIAAIFVFVSIIGWGLEDPFASHAGAAKTVETANHVRGGCRHRATNLSWQNVTARCAGCS